MVQVKSRTPEEFRAYIEEQEKKGQHINISVRVQFFKVGPLAYISHLDLVRTMMKIVVPQAVKNILPTLGNEFIALVKDTSVVSFVAAVDLYKTFTEIGNIRYEYLMPYLAMAIMYIVLVMLISFGVKLLEKRLKKNERSA